MTGIFLIFLFLLSLILEENGRNLLLRENGIVEGATATGYFLCLVFVLYKGRLQYLRHGHTFLILIVFFLLRELDFDKKFTTMGIFKSRFYISSDVLLIEKMAGIVVILILIYVAFSIAYRYFKDLSSRKKNHSSVPFGVFTILTLLVVSKFLDGIGRKLRGIGITMDSRMLDHAWAMEEILELGVPIIIFLTAMDYFEDTGNR